jgi:hypothetical protein
MIEASVVDAKGFVYERVRGPKECKIDDDAVDLRWSVNFSLGTLRTD